MEVKVERRCSAAVVKRCEAEGETAGEAAAGVEAGAEDLPLLLPQVEDGDEDEDEDEGASLHATCHNRCVSAVFSPPPFTLSPPSHTQSHCHIVASQLVHVCMHSSEGRDACTHHSVLSCDPLTCFI